MTEHQSRLGLIGGSGLNHLSALDIKHREFVRTPYGDPSGPLIFGHYAGQEIVFLARHGMGHTIPPHAVNFRANIWALHSVGVRIIIAVAAVGAITASFPSGGLAFPDQIIDYTYGREHTFFDGTQGEVKHVDFSYPYDAEVRHVLTQSAQECGFNNCDASCAYAATQGPRFESAAEIDRLERDGADIVGMTGMPECGLARELDIRYATIAVVSNAAAGRDGEQISLDDIYANLNSGIEKVEQVLNHAVPFVANISA